MGATAGSAERETVVVALNLFELLEKLVRETERLSKPDPTLTSNDAQLTYPPSLSQPVCSLSDSTTFFVLFCPLLPSRIWHSLTLELTSIYPDPDRMAALPLLLFRFLNSFVRGETN